MGAIPEVEVSTLPPEVKTTIYLISKDGPYPYSQDGTVFKNLERLLPAKPRGYYKEYTVATPGSTDRGSRRLITGQNGEIYYTADHYNTFQSII